MAIPRTEHTSHSVVKMGIFKSTINTLFPQVIEMVLPTKKHTDIFTTMPRFLKNTKFQKKNVYGGVS